MDLVEKMALISRNTEEVVRESELERLLSEKKKPIAYCGYEPSGEVHMGHMITVTKLADLERAGFKVKVLFADWHAWLNKKGSMEEIRELVKLWEKAFRKLGLKDPEFVRGSSFQKEKSYIEDVFRLSRDTTINRGLRAMQEVARDAENASVSQAIYPLMQVVDMKHLGIDVAQSGIEQRKIHMLARESLESLGYKKPVLVHTPLVNSLNGPGTKMSSSEPSSIISVRDSEDLIGKKIAKAHCEEGKPEGSAVLEIARLFVFPHKGSFEVNRPEKFGGNVKFNDYEELEKSFREKKLHPADLKNALGGYLGELLAPVRKGFE